MPIPSSENIYLDLMMLEKYGNEEMQKVYKLRQQVAKNKKRERESG